MDLPLRALVDHDRSAALGKSAPIDDVPVGFMVLATCPLILWLLDGTVAGMASAFLVIALFSVGLVCLSVGHRAHLAYDAAEAARRPRIPFKLLGSIVVALVIGLLASTKIVVSSVPILIGTAAFILCLVAFGLDPMHDKGVDSPENRRRRAGRRLYQDFDERFEEVLMILAPLGDDDLFERTRVAANTVMGLLATIDPGTPALFKMAPSVARMLDKMEAEVMTLLRMSTSGLTPFQRRKFLIKVQTMVEAFESRARKSGIAEGRNNFELQTDLLFERMNRNRAA